MPTHIRHLANYTGRQPRPVLAVAGCVAPASYYFGYWFSH